MPSEKYSPEHLAAIRESRDAVLNMARELAWTARRAGEPCRCECGFAPRTTRNGGLRIDDIEMWGHRNSHGYVCKGSWWNRKQVRT